MFASLFVLFFGGMQIKQTRKLVDVYTTTYWRRTVSDISSCRQLLSKILLMELFHSGSCIGGEGEMRMFESTDIYRVIFLKKAFFGVGVSVIYIPLPIFNRYIPTHKKQNRYQWEKKTDTTITVFRSIIPFTLSGGVWLWLKK